MSMENMEALAFYIEVCEGEISKFKNQLDATTDEADKNIIECRIANRQEELSMLKSKQVEMNGGNGMENRFIDEIEKVKHLIKRSEQRINELKNGDYFALTFLLAEQVHLNGLKDKLDTLEDLFFQLWMDDTQSYLDELHMKGLA
ncbi:hypothetical protein ABEW81_11015 [Priestia megaterium]